MIISKFISTKINNHNKEHYKKLGYDITLKELIVNVSDLPLNSSKLIDVECDYCGLEKKVYYKSYIDSTKSNNKYACKKCFSIKFKEIFINKYGVDNPSKLELIKDKKKKTYQKNYNVDHFSKTKEYQLSKSKTMLEKYGVNHALQSDIFKKKYKLTLNKNWGVDSVFDSKIIKDKINNSITQKWGVTNVFKSDKIKEKIKQTNLEKYGVEYSNQSKKVKEKIKQTNLLKYKTESYSKSTEFFSKTIIGNNTNYISYINNSTHLFLCEKGHYFEINIDNFHGRKRNNISLCTICNPIGDSTSIKEKELYEFIKSIYNKQIIQSYRDGLEIDIYLPDLKIGFEFNGIYWHSEGRKDKSYHLNKTNYFKEKEIDLFHIWEDQWDNKREIIKSKIKKIIGFVNNIFADDCNIVILKSNIDFLIKCHIKGDDRSIVKIGLLYKNELVSVMTFNALKNNVWKISRFCDELNIKVIGGFNMLLDYFINNYKPSKILLSLDKSSLEINYYDKLNFSKIVETKPNCRFVYNNKIWDCGTIKYELIIK